jgi:hypothetical protein
MAGRAAAYAALADLGVSVLPCELAALKKEAAATVSRAHTAQVIDGPKLRAAFARGGALPAAPTALDVTVAALFLQGLRYVTVYSCGRCLWRDYAFLMYGDESFPVDCQSRAASFRRKAAVTSVGPEARTITN